MPTRLVPPTETTLGEAEGYNTPGEIDGTGEIDDAFLGKEGVVGCLAGKFGEAPAHRNFAASVHGRALARLGYGGKEIGEAV